MAGEGGGSGGDFGGGGGSDKGSGDSGGGIFSDIGDLFGGSSDAGTGEMNLGSDVGATAVDPGSASPWVVDSPITSGMGDYLGTSGADAATSGGSPFVLDSPITPGTFDYLGGTAATGGTAAADPFQTGSMLPASNASGQPFAAGGTTAVSSGGAIDSTGMSTALAAPASGRGATSLAPAAASGAPADATSSWGDMLKKGLTSNPLGTAISAAGLGFNMLNGQKQTANQGALAQTAEKALNNNTKLMDAGIAQVGSNQGNADKIGAQGADLRQYLSTGQLPAQYSQQVDQAINDAKTTAISNAAKNGQPTDPTKNTSLAQQLAQIDNQRAGMTSKIAETLFNAGSDLTKTAANVGNASASSLLSGGQNAANLSGQLYTTLTGIDSKQSEQTAKAIAALAQSLNSGGSQKQATAP